MGFKKLIIGEKMPDKNDPKYRELYEKDVEAGKKFAKALRLGKGVNAIQNFASNNRSAFLMIIFIFVFVSLALNIYRMTRAYSTFNSRSTAVETQEAMLEAISEQTRLNSESQGGVRHGVSKALPQKYHRGHALELTPYKAERQ